eukprot:619316-Amphidinium_carterae.1
MGRLIRAEGNRSSGAPCDVDSEDLVLVHDELVGEAHSGNGGVVPLRLWGDVENVVADKGAGVLRTSHYEEAVHRWGGNGVAGFNGNLLTVRKEMDA